MSILNPRALTSADVTATLPEPRSVTSDEIAQRAYEIYCERSCRDGFDIDDWLRAERECAEASAPFASVRLRTKADRRWRGGPPPLFERRRDSW